MEDQKLTSDQIKELFEKLNTLKEVDEDLQSKYKEEPTPELEKEVKKSMKKVKRVRDQLIVHHIYIAEILAKKYVNKGIDYDDLFQVASLGLIFAIDRFDISKGYEFSSFATPTDRKSVV